MYKINRAGSSSCKGFSLSAASRGSFLVAMCWFLIAVPSLIVERRLQGTGSMILAHRFSCSRACGIFPEQGSNLRLLHQQEDSFPLSPDVFLSLFSVYAVMGRRFLFPGPLLFFFFFFAISVFKTIEPQNLKDPQRSILALPFFFFKLEKLSSKKGVKLAQGSCASKWTSDPRIWTFLSVSHRVSLLLFSC